MNSPADSGSRLWDRLERRDQAAREARDQLARALHVDPSDLARIGRDEAEAMFAAIMAERSRNPDRL